MNALASRLVERPPEDIAAEGMWRIAAGESCNECWDSLPESQKVWWRNCAMQAIGEWITCHCQGSRYPTGAAGSRPGCRS